MSCCTQGSPELPSFKLPLKAAAIAHDSLHCQCSAAILDFSVLIITHPLCIESCVSPAAPTAKHAPCAPPKMAAVGQTLIRSNGGGTPSQQRAPGGEPQPIIGFHPPASRASLEGAPRSVGARSLLTQELYMFKAGHLPYNSASAEYVSPAARDRQWRSLSVRLCGGCRKAA